jgi:hypothetical protein
MIEPVEDMPERTIGFRASGTCGLGREAEARAWVAA